MRLWQSHKGGGCVKRVEAGVEILSGKHKEDDPVPAIARFLKFWRTAIGLSQEELAHRLNSSQRHISRIESGHSRPSVAMVQELATVMNLGRRDSNHLLIAAGYSPAEKSMSFQSSELKWLRNAMMMNLRALDPYPTALLDSSSNILMVNRGWVGFHLSRVDADTLAGVQNYYDFMFSRDDANGVVGNWEDTVSVILMSLTQRALFTNSAKDIALAECLATHPSVPQNWQQRAAQLEPMASFRVQLNVNGSPRRFYSVSSTVGASGPSAYPSEPNLTIQTLYPEDDTVDMRAFLIDNLEHPKLFY